MGNRLREYEDQNVRKTLDPSFCPEEIRNAREVQDQIIIRRFKGAPIKIADVGCGDGYHGTVFAPACILYHGFEISTEMAEQARRNWRELGLTNAEMFVGDADDTEPEPDFYDVVWSLYFTPGNFRDEFDDISMYDDSYLDRNPRFVSIVSKFYRALKPGGTMFLTVYKDVPEAEQAQREFYHNTGQHVITPPGSRFVATAENFWSARWTRESMLSNLAECGIGPVEVTFNSLNSIAWLVEIGK
ncbi:MAG: class I SAM-dependent methyltransferase [bacterium]|nr:class I SAM-dependent methyltransferase [bacterium]